MVIAETSADILLLAPVLIFRLVLASAAVTGMPPINPEVMFASARASISFRSLNRVFVIRFATFAESMVSIIAMIAITEALCSKYPVIKNLGKDVGNR